MNNNTMTDAATYPLAPQASASTNSAIRAFSCQSDEECPEMGTESSARDPDEKIPKEEIPQENQPHGPGMRFDSRPDFEPPRSPGRMLQRWTTCLHCSRWYAAPGKELNRGRRIYCSIRCTADHAAETGRFKGANNPRWLGGVSNDNMRYRRRQKEKDPIHGARKPTP